MSASQSRIYSSRSLIWDQGINQSNIHSPLAIVEIFTVGVEDSFSGRLNFSRKSSIRSNEESGYRVFGLYRTKFARRSSGRNIGDERCGIVDGDRCGVDHELQNRYREADCKENGLNSGPNNKRKFSPVVRDRVDKQVRISSKSRIRSTSFVRSDIICSSSPKAVKDVTSIENCSVFGESDLQISSVESLVSNVSDDLGARTFEGCDQESGNEDGEYVQEPNLHKSKWAVNDSPVIGSDVNYSSPESREFKQEGFGRSGEVSSSSEDSGYLEDKGYSSFESDDDRFPNGLGLIPSCRNVHEFKRLGKISEGTYGVVHKARDLKTGDVVALKKVKMEREKEGFPVTALREINILCMLQHPSLVEMKEVVMDDFNGVYMVMECVDYELKGYMDRVKQPFSQSEVKRLMIQLLEGVSYLHENYVMHRDLKTSNLLLNKNGELKICDFGMSRQYATPLKPYTSLVVTLWYRAPELLLGMQNYTTAVDMWSVGCIMAELLSKKPLFDGGRELEQIDKIFRTLGTPNDSIWPGYSKLPGVKSNFVKQPCNCLRKKFPVATFTGSPTLTELGFDLLNKFLTYDPEKRISAKEALNHGWFFEDPLPADHVRIFK